MEFSQETNPNVGKNYKLVPWLNWEELDFVRLNLFSSSPISITKALNRIAALRSRGCLPVVVEVTASFIEIQQNDPHFREGLSNGTSDSEEMLAMLYTMAVMRPVNCVDHKKDGKSIAQKAKQLGIPRMLIDIRHGQFEYNFQFVYLNGCTKKVEHLWRLDGAEERLKLVKADLMEEGSFDEVVNGCEGVFHTASPVSGSKKDPKAEILEPAIKGTLNVLRSCKKNPSLRRVVLTSSSSTVRIRVDIDPDVPLDESVWSSTEVCEQFQVWYALSKIKAEKAAWNFCKENNIDLVTILPVFIIGPSLPPNLCSTASDVLGLFKGETSKFEFHGRMGYVHIDDIALCHILVFEHKEAHGRYLCSFTVMEHYELASFLASRYPSYPITKGFTKLDRPYYTYNTSKIESLGFMFKPLEEMFDGTVKSLIMQGHLQETVTTNMCI